MRDVEQIRKVYEQLAEWYDQDGQPKLRDWFLVLAADAAQAGGQPEEAERLRGRLLQRNPHHLLKPFATFAEALRSPDVQGYVADLRRTYPPAAAEQLLKTQQDTGTPDATAAEAPAPAPDKPAAAAKANPPEQRELKVYRIRTDPEEAEEPPAPMPRQAPPPRPAPRGAAPAQPAAAAPRPAPPAPRPAPPAPRPAPPPVQRARPEPLAPDPAPEPARYVRGSPTPTEPRMEPEDAPGRGATTAGAWLCATLFVFVLLLGLALAGYTLARPFLPEDWFR
jgi:hypothetical protein